MLRHAERPGRQGRPDTSDAKDLFDAKQCCWIGMQAGGILHPLLLCGPLAVLQDPVPVSEMDAWLQCKDVNVTIVESLGEFSRRLCFIGLCMSQGPELYCHQSSSALLPCTHRLLTIARSYRHSSPQLARSARCTR